MGGENASDYGLNFKLKCNVWDVLFLFAFGIRQTPKKQTEHEANVYSDVHNVV